MKSGAKLFIARILGWQVRRLSARNDFKVIAISGSIGKTSTKLAIAHTLRGQFRVNYQAGNYNDIVTTPLVFFNSDLGGLFNPFFWLLVFMKNEVILRRKYPYDVVVLELGTDGPGQISQFGSYVKADIGVLSAVAPEHMEYFADLNEVAEEELGIAKMSRQLLVNKDLVEARYLQELAKRPLTYGIRQPSDFRLQDIKFKGSEASFSFWDAGKEVLKSAHQQISEPQLYSVIAAAAVGHLMGMEPARIDEGLRSIPAVSGRMQYLAGVNGSLIIDDTYNASPEAVRAALDTLYRMDSPQRIAVLGNMNELGKYSPQEHEAVGDHIDGGKLDLVLTIGPEANKYLAPKAEAKGVMVKNFEDPLSAGRFLKTHIRPGAVILVKGSQNKVFAEETVKQILADPADAAKLVRQSPSWMKAKQRCFPSVKIK
jgi:UDP-N-acetylmuramyl pentapeptide synthase